jgi:hypothetical protein
MAEAAMMEKILKFMAVTLGYSMEAAFQVLTVLAVTQTYPRGRIIRNVL